MPTFEIVCAIVHQLTRNLSPEEIEHSGFAPYYVDHTLALWPQSQEVSLSATTFQSKGDPITDLHEDLSAEQKARTTYDNILRLIKDPEVCDPIRFLSNVKSSTTNVSVKVYALYRKNSTAKTSMLSILNLTGNSVRH